MNDRYELNAGGITVEALAYGATIAAIHVPDRNGDRANVVLHFDDPNEYARTGPERTYRGATIGRYANRIAGAKFSIDGDTYELSANDHGNTLHGGARGFDAVVWRAVYADGDRVTFAHTSPDGDQGFPGKLDVSVTFDLTARGLRITYTAVSDRDTVVNFANHSYFNLGGVGDCSGYVAQVFANDYTPVDEQLIPTGEIASVEGTRFDFRAPRQIGAQPYDANFILNVATEGLRRAALLGDPLSGRVLEVHTTEPGLQMYTGDPHGVALETQHFPDSPNHPQFPSTLLRAGVVFSSTTLLLFTAAQASPSA